MHLSYLTTILAISVSACGSPIASNSSQPYIPKRLIGLEEHSVAPVFEAEAVASGINSSLPGSLDRLNDVGSGRLSEMDAGHLSLAVMSQNSPSGTEDPDGCIEANNWMRDAILANPTRFAGFAVLPLATPDQAAAELERAVTELGFKGAMIWSHLKDGTYYDEDNGRFDPIFAKAQELDVPLYLHPAPTIAEVAEELYDGDYVQPQSASALASQAWGWDIDVGNHILRLYAAGIFDRFPKIKIILGHNGEDLPMFIDRIDTGALRTDDTFYRVWTTNLWVTTSGFLTLRAFKQLLVAMPIERIMYSVDYPFSKYSTGWEFVKQLAEEEILTVDEMDMFAYKNAEKLLSL